MKLTFPHGLTLDASRPRVMGILNATPDSFLAESRVNRTDALNQASRMVSDGADLLDLGGQSTRPGAERVGPAKEWNRIRGILDDLLEQFPGTPISVDTFHAEVARKALNAGAHLINDVSGGQMDPDMVHVVAESGAPYILMHMQGTPDTMQIQPEYQDVVDDVISALAERLDHVHKLGVDQVILDVGFGFGKRLMHNYQLLFRLSELQALDCPLLVGISRKSMIHKALNISPEEALNGTTALHAWALDRGANLLRVHDVREAVECVRLHQYLHSANAARIDD